MVVRPAVPADARLADYRLPDGGALVTRGLFVAEGRLVVRRLIQASPYRTRSVLLSEPALAALADVVAALDPDVPVFVVPASWMEEITGFNIHRGCLAIGERRPIPAFADWLSAKPEACLLVGLEGVGNADNVGGILRNAAAFGADAVVLDPGCGDPFYRKAVRTSSGAALTMPVAAVADWEHGIDAARAAGWLVVALTPRGAVALPDLRSVVAGQAGGRKAPTRLLLLAGAEGPGLSDRTTEQADLAVRIPTTANVDSVNVAVAVGIALYEAGLAVSGSRAPTPRSA